ncbi:MAG: alkaline phosphatase family protein [Bryobacterales bacterium]|nr:alkaline phosphatase family protein [Bryobacterales bacterium]
MNRRRFHFAVAAVLLALWIWSPPADEVSVAYVGPGAGFAFLGSLLALVAGFLLSLASLLLWPFRVLRASIRRRRAFRHARVRKLIFLGLDGLDHGLTERYLKEGKLPNLARLREQGSFSPLRTTFPSLSPVAWSTFATGVSPARHNIFDFLNRSLRSYLPELSSARVEAPRRMLRIGKFRIPLSRPLVEFRRRSRAFWTILGEHGVTCTILRVPITFPPEKFDGRVLSAMSTPDLKGTQGSFSQFTTRLAAATFENGARYPLRREGDVCEGEIEGPDDMFLAGSPPLRIPFRLRKTGDAAARLEIAGETYELRAGEYSPWIRLPFRTALGVRAYGIARFLLTGWSGTVDLYVSPINIDPSRPALPISHPSAYSVYLANLLGPFATVGMAEDTWALNEGVIDERAFLQQAYSIFEEREAMFLSALENTRRGVVACVFDTSDRIQHMFYRQLGSSSEDVIEAMYRRMDELVGKTMAFAGNGTALFVLSDHGFCSFRRGVNLNTWLYRNGYLTLREGARESGPFFKNVDWSRTRAYALGLSGLYLNLEGREASGIVRPGAEADALARELIAGLEALRDSNEVAPVRRVYRTAALYRGPYLDAAPDLIVGYAEGYRVAWDAATGKTGAEVIEDNDKAWSGDHCVDPLLVPGVLFSNVPIDATDPGIEDMAPTALRLFGVPVPAWMEGAPVLGDAVS